MNGTPAEVLANAEMMQLMLPILRADFQICETYEPRDGPPLDCPITIFGGTDDKITLEELTAWKDYTLGPFKVQVFPGDHFFIRNEENGISQTIFWQLRRNLLERGYTASGFLTR
jgi:medium-chain acyl-[acyl-carrier-protein] hydrolase